MNTIKLYLRLLRPHQYLKNFFIFMPLFFSLKITNFPVLISTLMIFISFSMIASSIYIFNDYYDAPEDRHHPKKKNRPIASGEIPERSALSLMIAFLASGLASSYLIGGKTVSAFVLGYVVLNISYTLKLKQIAIIDIFIIAIGFILRLFIGAQVGHVALSIWIIIMTFLLALFLALTKRRDDIIIYEESGTKVRKAIEGYNIEFLNASMIIMTSVIIVSYIMYTLSSEVIGKLHSDKLYITVLFVILGIMRYLQITLVEKMSDSPTEVLIKDRFLQITILGWFLTFVFLLYF
ncbi:MAG TPA: UbiA prenyltransferase family protein [Nitrospiria bacterium]|nr:UbiA prenyltransferase family protein [Nitrospiria bacterium]